MNFKKIAIVVIAYASVVILFESLLGYYQPQSDGTLTITTNSAGSRMTGCCPESSPTSSYTLRPITGPVVKTPVNPEVTVTDGETKAYTAVAVAGNEHEQVDQPLPLAFRALTGFPPRYFVRLDPR